MTDASTADPVEPAVAETRWTDLSVEFTGSAGVYFRIWIVNLCLTLLTLGIFSAWAKVRKKRYFYASIQIDDTPLQYLAQPLPILKGRVIAAILFSVWWFSSSFFLPALPWVLGFGLLVAPWIVTSSAAFNARYSAWRNLTFVFHGNYLGAAATIYWLGLIPLIAISMMFQTPDLTEDEVSLWMPLIWQGVVFLIFGLLFPWWLNRLKRFVATNTAYGGHRVRYGARGGQFFGVYFAAGIAVVFSGVVSGVLFATLNTVAQTTAGLVILSLPFYLGYVFAFAHVKAQTTNLVWNQARLGPVKFRSTLESADLFLLYLTNALAIVASIGLATPWAVMRTMRYRIEHLEASTKASLAAFTGDSRSTVHAAAAETGDFFDLDLSL